MSTGKFFYKGVGLFPPLFAFPKTPPRYIGIYLNICQPFLDF
jgi:hypothetical protein